MNDEDDLIVNTSERILGDVKNFIKQVYHEAVNRELSPVNRTYICGCLIKALDETLRHGLKTRHLGYWKIIRKLIHPDLYEKLEKLPGFGTSEKDFLANGRAWICLALLDDAFVSYINCFVREKRLNRYYEKWSIVLSSDLVNRFVSFITGLENVSFAFELVDTLSLPVTVQLYPRLVLEERAISPVDSGVASSLDLINGNIVEDSLVRRRGKKDGSAKRHVSFHEDSIERTSGRGRKLVWDAENARYSWGGEDLESLKMSDIRTQLNINARGNPEGQETCSKFILKRNNTNNLVKNPTKLLHLKQFEDEIQNEISTFRPMTCPFEIQQLPTKLMEMLDLKGNFKSYKLWSRILVLSTDSVLLLDKKLTVTRIKYSKISQIIISPHLHSFDLQTNKNTYCLTTGCQKLTEEILGRLEWNIRWSKLPLINFLILQLNEFMDFRNFISQDEEVIYLGLVRVQSDVCVEENVDGVSKRGFLMYQFDRGDSWTPAEFLLRGGILYLFGKNNQPESVINIKLQCLSCDRIYDPHRPHMFSLTVKDADTLMENAFYADLASKTDFLSSNNWRASLLGKLTNQSLGQWVTQLLPLRDASNSTKQLIFAAADEYELSDWMQSILQVFCQNSIDHNNDQMEIINDALLLLTQNRAMIFNQSQNSLHLLSSTLIQELTSFRMGPEAMDSYCIIELESMEASNTTSDWIFHFGSKEELIYFKSILERYFIGKFPVEISSDAKCIRHQSLLTKEWFA